MTVTVAELHRTASALDALATRLEGDAERHDGAYRSLQTQLDALDAAGTAPDLDAVLGDGRRALGNTSGVVGQLQAGASAARTAASTAERLAERLGNLQRRRSEARADLTRARNQPQNPSTTAPYAASDTASLQRRVGELDGQMQSVHSEWIAACQSASGAISPAGNAVRRARNAAAAINLAIRGARGVRTAWEGYGLAGLAAQVARSSIRSGAFASSWRNLRNLNNGLRTAADFPPPRDSRGRPITGRESRRHRRQQMRRHNRPIQNRLPGARNRFNTTRHELRTDRRLTRVGQALQNNRHYVRFARGVGVLGIATSGVSMVGAIREGDVEGAITSGVTVAGSAMLMFPATAPMGAVLVAGALIYENREAIGDAARKAGDAVQDAAGWVGDKLSKLNPFG